jgi:hypothetical protein
VRPRRIRRVIGGGVPARAAIRVGARPAMRDDAHDAAPAGMHRDRASCDFSYEKRDVRVAIARAIAQHSPTSRHAKSCASALRDPASIASYAIVNHASHPAS